MSDTSVVYEGGHRLETQKDPVAQWLWIAIGVVVVALLTGLAFALVSGWLSPTGPRTALEARIVTAADAVNKYPTSGRARYDLIVTLGLSGQDRQARSQADAAKRDLKGVQLPYAYLGEATLDLNGGRYRDAITIVDQGLKVEAAAFEVERKRLARERILATRPDSLNQVLTQFDLVKAQASVKLGDWKGSAAALTAALEVDPLSADVLVLRAVTYRQMGDLSKARVDYQKALSLIPGYQPAVDGLKQIGAQ